MPEQVEKIVFQPEGRVKKDRMTQDNRNVWEWAEGFVNKTLSQNEIAVLEEKKSAEPAFEQEFFESVGLIRSLKSTGRVKNFRKTLQSVHEEQSVSPSQRVIRRLVRIPAGAWRTAAVAATVALVTSTITYWSLTPSIKKNDSQYNTISREVEHIKTGLKNNTAEIETIKKNAVVAPVRPSSDVKMAGTGFAISNDGYFVTAWHVINHGVFDSVYILNNNGDYYKAFLVGHDDQADIAVMKVDEKNFKFNKGELPYTIANAKAPIGARIFSIGYPKEDEVYSEGYVSSRNGYEGDKLQYTLDLPATYGQSGSPVIDANGNIIGILTAVGSQGEPSTYAVSTHALLNLIQDNPALSKLHLRKSGHLSGMARELQVSKLEPYTFSVKVYKK